MGDVYVRKLKKIQTEYNTNIESLRYTEVTWHTDQRVSYSGLDSTTIESVRIVFSESEKRYIIILTSFFEGILREYMNCIDDKDINLYSLIDSSASKKIYNHQTGKQQSAISESLKKQAHAVRTYRNYLIHQGRQQPRTFTFSEALACLSTFVSKLP